MKYFKYILICFLYYSSASVFGQIGVQGRLITSYDNLDMSNWRVAYSLEYVWDAESPTLKAIDVGYLDIGTKISKYYSYTAYAVDSIYTVSTSDTYESAREAFPEEVYKNSLLNLTNVVYRTPIPNGDDFLYTDDYCHFKWEIHSDKKTILGYSCQKATTTFRGRTWEAWFTIEIPISDGPWKFCGLSGLILEVSDSQKHFLFTCTSIEQKQAPIVMYKWVYEKTTREKLNELLVYFHANYKSYLEGIGVKLYTVKDGKPIPAPDNFNKPYNPIELE